MRAAVALALLVAASTPVEAKEIPISAASGHCSPTLKDAATAALSRAMVDPAFEYGGAIYLRDGEFCYTLPVTQKSRKHVLFEAVTPGDALLVAMYHTHPKPKKGVCDEFSPKDKDLAHETKLLSFIGFHGSKSIRMYDPKKDFVPHELSTCDTVARGGTLVASL